MAVTGHRTSKEVTRYTRAASQPHLADAAQTKRARANREQKLANLGDEFAKPASRAASGWVESIGVAGGLWI